MSDVVRLSSALPADEVFNGLDSKAQRLIDTPEEFLIAVVWLDTSKVVRQTDSGDEIPYVRIRRIVPIGDASDVAPAVRDVVEKAEEQRTGARALPFEQGSVDEPLPED